jgi:hypothetical protein
MSPATAPGKPGRPVPGTRPVPIARPVPGGRRAMSAGLGIFLISAGAILRFAVAGGSQHGLNVHVVGVILILAGAVGLLLPRLTARAPQDRLRRWVRPDQHRAYDEPPTGAEPGAYDDRPALVQNPSPPTQRASLTDDLLSK